VTAHTHVAEHGRDIRLKKVEVQFVAERDLRRLLCKRSAREQTSDENDSREETFHKFYSQGVFAIACHLTKT
jgi:hypothetical protein